MHYCEKGSEILRRDWQDCWGRGDEGRSHTFFDDVVSEGLSKVDGIRPLGELGAKVEYLMVVVDREQGGRERLEMLGYKVKVLSKISELTTHLCRFGYISKKQTDAVLRYIRESRLDQHGA